MNLLEDEPVEVNVTFLFVSREGDAIKVEDADGRQVWLEVKDLKGGPEPQDWDEGADCTFTILTSVATRKGLI